MGDTTNPPTDPSNRGIELLRRLLFVGGILCAAWFVVITDGSLWRVKDVRFDELQKSEVNRMANSLKTLSRESGMAFDSSLNPAATQSLDAFIADQTKDRLIRVDGSEWPVFFDDVAATLSGKSTTFSSGLSEDTGTSYLYFPPAASPLQSLASQVNQSHVFSYVALPQNGQTRYLEVLAQAPKDAMHYAPASLVYPERKLAVWVFLAAVLSYALLPWPKYGPRTLSYCQRRFRSVVLPDILGVILIAFFVIIPVLVISSNYDSPILNGLFDVETGWVWLTVAMWTLAALLFGVTLTALWYSVFWLTLLPEGIRYKTLFGIRECAYSDIERVDPARLSLLPRWLKIVMILAGFLNWRLMGIFLVGATRESHGIRILRKDGSSFHLWLDYLDGLGRVFRELRRANVPMASELVQYVDQQLAEFPGEEPWPNANRRRSVLLPVLLALTVTLSLGIHFWPSPPRKLITESRSASPEVMAQRTRLLEEMTQVRNELEAATQRYKEAPPERQSQELENMTTLMNRFNELSKKHDALSSDDP